MGFSLQGFFDNLNEIIHQTAGDKSELFDKLAAEIADGEQYARECGMLPAEKEGK